MTTTQHMKFTKKWKKVKDTSLDLEWASDSVPSIHIKAEMVEYKSWDVTIIYRGTHRVVNTNIPTKKEVISLIAKIKKEE